MIFINLSHFSDLEKWSPLPHPPFQKKGRRRRRGKKKKKPTWQFKPNISIWSPLDHYDDILITTKRLWCHFGCYWTIVMTFQLPSLSTIQSPLDNCNHFDHHQTTTTISVTIKWLGQFQLSSNDYNSFDYH